MAISPMDVKLPHHDQIDRFSSLPDALVIMILSLLPTHIAARTSVLSRYFRHLWEASPSLELVSRDMKDNFIAMAKHVILNRDNKLHPLLILRLEISGKVSYTCHCIVSTLLFKVCTFNLCHLDIQSCDFKHIVPALPAIFSMKSLESLSLPTVTDSVTIRYKKYNVMPSAICLIHLRSLSLEMYLFNPAEFHRVISELCSLENLHVKVKAMRNLSISSNTIRKLMLVIGPSSPHHYGTLMLRLPSLELLHLDKVGNLQLPKIQGEIPLLRKAVLNLSRIFKHNCSWVLELLNYVSHVEELFLQVKESHYENHPFPILSAGKEIPNFPQLKHLEATMCFHKHNVEGIISILHHFPALESLKLIHELPELFTGTSYQRAKKDWKSKLPSNADGNHCYAYFGNLHLKRNQLDFLRH